MVGGNCHFVQIQIQEPGKTCDEKQNTSIKFENMIVQYPIKKYIPGLLLISESVLTLTGSVWRKQISNWMVNNIKHIINASIIRCVNYMNTFLNLCYFWKKSNKP